MNDFYKQAKTRTSKKRQEQGRNDPNNLTSTGPLVKLELNHNSNHNNKVFYCLGLFFNTLVSSC
ncbi:hypothetical protein BDA99DRAFT_511181 [Phascolomyces articulosus]|uniref:Uncharacterized protein n=1 Tax=Phascolomyces articulosus TaxID=60185 RepID=A0AAD5PE40_9FUNG|nr:hypothetical protein BDA99DRAFT_511181 [Phascolomyces articulosus]